MNMELLEDHQLSPEEQAIGSRRAFGFLLPMLAKRRKPMLVAFALLSGATILSLVWPILLKRAFDVNLAAGDYTGLVITALTITALQGIHLLLQYWQRIRLETIGQDVMVELKQRLFDHILAQDVAFFDRNPVGRLMARVESDTEALRQLFTTTAVVLVGDLLLIGGTFAVMAYYSWRLMLILLGIIPVLAVMVTI
ncbi:hypothetical protein C3F09_12905, partial [candidate division GN15 bacterium]